MKRTLATLGVVGLGLISLTAPAIAAPDQVVVCHWDGSTLTQMSFNVNGTGGHDQHPDDIIPPTTKMPEGKNWNNEGKLRYVNECGATLPPGEVIETPVDNPVVDPPVVTPPVEQPPVVTPPAEEPPVVTPPAEQPPAVVNQPVVDPPTVTPPAETPAVESPAAVAPAAVPVQPAPAKQAVAAPQAAPKAAPVQAPAVVGTNQGYNAQTAVGASDGGTGLLAGVGALVAAGAAAAARRRSRLLNNAG